MEIEDHISQWVSRIRDSEVEYMKTVEAILSDEKLKTNDDADKLIFAINPETCAPAYIALLAVKTNKVQTNPLLFLQQINKLLENPNPALFLPLAKHLVEISKTLSESMIAMNKPKLAIKAVHRLCKLAQTSSDQMTPIHAHYIKLCLISKCYSLATRLCDLDIYEVNHEITAPADYLLYCYYSSLIYIGLKMFDKAMDMMVKGLSVPANCLSQIMIEIYKRYILISLIHIGEVEPLPKFISSSIIHRLHSYSQLYVDFASLYTTLNRSSISSFITSHADFFISERTHGLVKQCLASVHQRKMQRITKCFLTLSLSDISSEVELSPSDTERNIISMIDHNTISAKIHHNLGTVCFEENPQNYNSAAIREFLHSQIKQSMHLTNKLKLINETNQIHSASKKSKKRTAEKMAMAAGIMFDESLDTFAD